MARARYPFIDEAARPRWSKRIESALLIGLGGLGLLAITLGAVAVGIVILVIALLSVAIRLRVQASGEAKERDIKVIEPRVLAALCVIGGIGFGILTVIAFQSSSNAVAGAASLLITVSAAVGALFFWALARTLAAVQRAVNGEKVLAEGIGRLAGGIRGQVVVATDRRMVSIFASLVTRPAISVSLPYQAVEGFEASTDSLVVYGHNGRIALTGCAPNQVSELQRMLRRHTRPGQRSKWTTAAARCG